MILDEELKQQPFIFRVFLLQSHICLLKNIVVRVEVIRTAIVFSLVISRQL